MSPSWMSGCDPIGLSVTIESSLGRGDGFTSSYARSGVPRGRPTLLQTWRTGHTSFECLSRCGQHPLRRDVRVACQILP